jgi:hypothetical protein
MPPQTDIDKLIRDAIRQAEDRGYRKGIRRGFALCRAEAICTAKVHQIEGIAEDISKLQCPEVEGGPPNPADFCESCAKRLRHPRQHGGSSIPHSALPIPHSE